MQKLRLRGVCLGLLFGMCGLLLSCGDDGNSEPDIAGLYSGTIQDSVAGPGTVTATIVQDGADLTGTWQSLFNNPNNNNGGNLTGTIHDTSIILVLETSNPNNCPYDVTAILVSPVEISGNYAAFNCSRAITGTLDVVRQ